MTNQSGKRAASSGGSRLIRARPEQAQGDQQTEYPHQALNAPGGQVGQCAFGNRRWVAKLLTERLFGNRHE